MPIPALGEAAGLDWHGMFAISTPLAEIFIRGTVVYFLIFFALRLSSNEARERPIS